MKRNLFPHTVWKVVCVHELFNFPNAIYSMSFLASSVRQMCGGVVTPKFFFSYSQKTTGTFLKDQHMSTACINLGPQDSSQKQKNSF